jgi:type II secretory pathway component PulK
MNRPQHGAEGERGSAYLIALMVLFVLTTLGLSLSIVTQTEILAGAQERVIERTFYAADSGIELSIARALADGNFGPVVHERSRSELEQGQLMAIRERVQSSTFFCVDDTPCNLCSVNQGRSYARRNHLLAVNATRLAEGDTEVALGRKSLSSMVDVEPYQAVVDCLAEMPEATSGYRFDDF